MTESVQSVAHPSSQSFEFESEFDDLPIPSMDSLFDDTSLKPLDPESGFGFDECVDLDSFFNDPDIFYLPGDHEQFLIPNGDGFLHPGSDPSHETPIVSNSNFNWSVWESNLSVFPAVSGECKRKDSSTPSTASRDSCADRTSNDGAKVSEDCRCDRESCGGPVSSQDSGNCGSGVDEAMNSLSPDSSHSGRGVLSDMVIEQNFKIETEKNCVPKRKREHEEENNLYNSGSRTCKYQRSSTPMENINQQGVGSVSNVEEKRKARLTRNRESAQLSRQRKKDYVVELEHKVKSMRSTIAGLNSKISFFMAENATLRQQLSSSGLCPQGAPGMYPHPPMAPMAYPWVSCAPYFMKPQEPVPLVPIPRLKPQQPVPALKTKKSESKKTGGKTKKVASISFLGVLLFIILFGGLVPMVNLKFGDFVNDVYGSDKSNSQHRGRVLHVHGHINGSERGKGIGFYGGNFDVPDKISCHMGSGYDLTHHGSHPAASSSEFDYLGNTSEPLVASLYVPRNDKLVKIDGNLIIHSVLATEKNMASRNSNEKKDNGGTGLAIARDHASALAIPEVGRNGGRNPQTYQSMAEHQKALATGSESPHVQYKLSASDGTTQQWFLEGLAGPMLSSGTCSEVFRFDVSPTPGAIIPADSVTNVTVNSQNGNNPNKGGNRRILHGLPVSVPGSGLNIAEEPVRSNPQESHHGNKSVSSVVVSVLVDPREAGDSGADGMITTKSLSRIFVVVLIDSVKYVTYSCMLPRSAPQMVTS